MEHPHEAEIIHALIVMVSDQITYERTDREFPINEREKMWEFMQQHKIKKLVDNFNTKVYNYHGFTITVNAKLLITKII